MLTFQGFFLKDNNDKKPFHAGQKVNSKKKKKQEMPIPCRSQKVNVKEEEYLTSKAQKIRKVISTTCVNAENKPKSLNSYISKEPKDVIKE